MPTPPPPYRRRRALGLEKNKEKTFLVQVSGPFLVKWLLFPFFNTDAEATSKCTCSNIVLNETFFDTFSPDLDLRYMGAVCGSGGDGGVPLITRYVLVARDRPRLIF